MEHIELALVLSVEGISILLYMSLTVQIIKITGGLIRVLMVVVTVARLLII